jgi:hypothetical protein
MMIVPRPFAPMIKSSANDGVASITINMAIK